MRRCSCGAGTSSTANAYPPGRAQLPATTMVRLATRGPAGRRSASRRCRSGRCRGSTHWSGMTRPLRRDARAPCCRAGSAASLTRLEQRLLPLRARRAGERDPARARARRRVEHLRASGRRARRGAALSATPSALERARRRATCTPRTNSAGRRCRARRSVRARGVRRREAAPASAVRAGGRLQPPRGAPADLPGWSAPGRASTTCSSAGSPPRPARGLAATSGAVMMARVLSDHAPVEVTVG